MPTNQEGLVTICALINLARVQHLHHLDEILSATILVNILSIAKLTDYV
jgi:hypothetical protein